MLGRGAVKSKKNKANGNIKNQTLVNHFI